MAKIGFIGCHEISFHCLKRICNLSKEFNDEVVIAFDLDKDESLKHSASISLEALQEEFGFNLHHVKNIADEDNIKFLKEKNLDILFIIGWHRIVPQIVLDQAKICVGLHTSLLPKDRGSSPINWKLIRGCKNGGVTLFHLSSDVDSGPIIAQKDFSIDFEDTVQIVYFKSTLKSLDLLDENWLDLHNLNPKKILPDESLATINERRRPIDGLIDWTKSATDCYNWIRALTHPYPGAFTFWKGKKILIWKSLISNKEDRQTPGTIIESNEKILVSTGNGVIEIILLQAESEPLCNASVFKNSYSLKKGNIFENS